MESRTEQDIAEVDEKSKVASENDRSVLLILDIP
jgi:hypothetical protein